MRTGGFDMRGAGEAVAVASSSPSKNTSALDVMRFQRINPDSLPLANGSGSSSSSASRKLPVLAPRSSTDVVHDAPAVAADTSRLASYLANTSLEQHKPRARAPAASSSAAAAALVIRDHVQQPSAAPNPNAVAAPDVSMRLQWGHNKRSRGRRESPATSAPAPPPETPAQARRRASLKIQRRNAAAAAAAASAEKLMPPPGARGGPVIRAASSLQPRPAAAAAADALYGRTTVALQHHRSAEEPRAGDPHPSARQQQQQQRPHRQATEKEKGKAPLVPEPPKQPQPQQQQQAAGAGELQKLVVAARPEMPRIVTALTRKEKEEDFLAMKGTKLPPRPKKRNKAVEKAVCQICPGQWLSDVSRARYMVREKKSRKQKRGGGLKAMDSDSD
uniref:Uncharacterized protein n=1 Tax=Avena sativa TaxID=4498 RepID=A0ACD5TZY5_AVESA